jgi:hypothetical protein
MTLPPGGGVGVSVGEGRIVGVLVGMDVGVSDGSTSSTVVDPATGAFAVFSADVVQETGKARRADTRSTDLILSDTVPKRVLTG